MWKPSIADTVHFEEKVDDKVLVETASTTSRRRSSKSTRRKMAQIASTRRAQRRADGRRRDTDEWPSSSSRWRPPDGRPLEGDGVEGGHRVCDKEICIPRCERDWGVKMCILTCPFEPPKPKTKLADISSRDYEALPARPTFLGIWSNSVKPVGPTWLFASGVLMMRPTIYYRRSCPR